MVVFAFGIKDLAETTGIVDLAHRVEVFVKI
jgi:hypothetical protein